MSHSYVMLFTKSPRYFIDMEALREGFKSDHGSGNPNEPHLTS